MSGSQDREATKKEIRKEYSGLFDKLTESEQIRTEAVLNFNLGGKWTESLDQILFIEDGQTMHSEILTISKK